MGKESTRDRVVRGASHPAPWMIASGALGGLQANMMSKAQAKKQAANNLGRILAKGLTKEQGTAMLHKFISKRMIPAGLLLGAGSGYLTSKLIKRLTKKDA